MLCYFLMKLCKNMFRKPNCSEIKMVYFTRLGILMSPTKFPLQTIDRRLQNSDEHLNRNLRFSQVIETVCNECYNISHVCRNHLHAQVTRTRYQTQLKQLVTKSHIVRTSVTNLCKFLIGFQLKTVKYFQKWAT